MGLLDGDLAQSIYDGFKGRLSTGVIRQSEVPTSGALDQYGDPADLATTDTALEGFFEEYDAMYITRAGIPKDSVKVNIFAKSCPGITPRKGNLVKLTRGGVDRWFQLRRVQTDPAQALWTCPDAYEIGTPS